MQKGKQLYEGKAKRVYETDDPKAVIVDYKDDATAFDGKKKGSIAGKGVINNRMSNYMFRMLETKGVPTHFIKELSERETLVKRVEIVPVEVIVRNVAAGSMAKRYGLTEGSALLCPVIEYSLKSDALGDPLMNASHAIAMGLATPEELATIDRMALVVREELTAYMAQRGIRLVDFKLEFGRFEGGIVLADEISPDTCRLWDMETNEKLDKDRFRRDLGGVEEAYQEAAHRLMD